MFFFKQTQQLSAASARWSCCQDNGNKLTVSVCSLGSHLIVSYSLSLVWHFQMLVSFTWGLTFKEVLFVGHVILWNSLDCVPPSAPSTHDLTARSNNTTGLDKITETLRKRQIHPLNSRDQTWVHIICRFARKEFEFVLILNGCCSFALTQIVSVCHVSSCVLRLYPLTQHQLVHQQTWALYLFTCIMLLIVMETNFHL